MEEDTDNTELWLTWNDHAQTLKSVVSTLRHKKLYADVTLVCGAKQFPVHKFILSTCSAYFEKLLETIPGNHPVVVLTNTSPKDLEALLDFMYLGQTEVNSQDLDRLLDIAFEFRIRGLISARDDFEQQNQEKAVEETVAKPDDVTEDERVDAVVTPAFDPLSIMMETQDNEEEPKQNGPEFAEVDPSDVTSVKVEEDSRTPQLAQLESGMKEYQNFIQKLMQESEEADTLEVKVEVKPTSPVKKSSKHHDTKLKRGKSKSKIEKHKTDIKKDKEKIGKNRTENSKEKAKTGKAVDETKTRIMMCPGCKKTFMSQSVLEAHMKTHEDLEIVTCPECPYKALSKPQMQKHMMTHQQRIEQTSRPYRCPYCPARQVDKSSFLRHQKTLHPDKKVVNMSSKIIHEDYKSRRVRPNKFSKDLVRS